MDEEDEDVEDEGKHRDKVLYPDSPAALLRIPLLPELGCRRGRLLQHRLVEVLPASPRARHITSCRSKGGGGLKVSYLDTSGLVLVWARAFTGKQRTLAV